MLRLSELTFISHRLHRNSSTLEIEGQVCLWPYGFAELEQLPVELNSEHSEHLDIAATTAHNQKLGRPGE